MASRNIENTIDFGSSNPPEAEPRSFKVPPSNTVASIMVPPPDPPPIRTRKTEAETFYEDHYETEEPSSESPVGYPAFSAFLSLKHGKLPTSSRHPETRDLHHPETKQFEERTSYFFFNWAGDGRTNLILLAIGFFIGAISALHWIQNRSKKLDLLSGLAVAFAGSLVISTTKRRRDASAANAAYAAVLMALIGGNITAALETSTNTGLGPTTLLTISTTTQGTATVTALSTIVETVTAQGLNATATGSLVASQTSSTPLSTSSVSTTSSGGLSQAQKIGLGVGLGVGIPVVVVGLLLFLNRQKLKRKPPLRIEPIHQGLY